MTTTQTQQQDTKNGNALATQAAAATVEVAPRTGEIVRVGFETVPGFEAMQRVGKVFAVSSLVPKEYQNNLANCVIAVNMAIRLGADPLMVMQNLYIVHGRPGWSSQFLISGFNTCGRFTAIRYRFTGKKSDDTWGCIAWAKEIATGELLEGTEVTLAMARSEGWVEKSGSKWKTMPEQMLRYRSAAFLIRSVAPEITMGLQTREEIEDVGEEAAEVFTAPPIPAALPPAIEAAPASEMAAVADTIAEARRKLAETVAAQADAAPPPEPGSEG